MMKPFSTDSFGGYSNPLLNEKQRLWLEENIAVFKPRQEENQLPTAIQPKISLDKIVADAELRAKYVLRLENSVSEIERYLQKSNLVINVFEDFKYETVSLPNLRYSSELMGRVRMSRIKLFARRNKTRLILLRDFGDGAEVSDIIQTNAWLLFDAINQLKLVQRMYFILGIAQSNSASS